MQGPLRSVSLPQHRRHSQSIHSRLRLSHTPTHVTHTKRGTFHLRTQADLGARSSQSCTPHIPSPLTNRLHISHYHHPHRQNLTNHHRVPTLPMRRRESPHPLFCTLWLNYTQQPQIPFFSAKARTIWPILSVALSQRIPDRS